MNVFHKVLSRTVGTLAAFLFLCVGIAQAQWVDAPSVPTTGNLWAFGTAYYDGKIYTFGGVTNNSQTLSNGTYVFDIAGNSWQAGPNMFQGKYQHTVAVLNDRIYEIGGLIGSGQQVADYTNTVNSYDPVGKSFRQEAALPRSSYNAAAVSVDGKIFVLGGQFLQGTTLYYTGNALVYSSGTWTEVTNGAPFVGRNMAATVMGNTIYLCGGIEVSNNQLVYATRAFKGTVSGNNITWSPIATPPSVTVGASLSEINGKLLLAGGTSNVDNYRNAYLYDPVADTWEPYYLLPSERSSARMVGDGTAPYMIGGTGTTSVLKATLGAPTAIAVYNQSDMFISMKPGTQATQGASVSNNGVVPLTVNATIPVDAQGWLAGATQSIAPGTTSAFNFTVNASSLAEGNYSTTVSLATNDANNPKHDVNIYLYVGDPGVDQPTKVVFEEGSGDWCQYCPDGHRVLKEVEAQYGDKVMILSYHGGGDNQDPLMISEGTQIVGALGLPGWPSGAINRLMFPGETAPMVNRGSWATYVGQVLTNQPTALANLEVADYNFDPTTRRVTATVSVTPSVWTAPQNLRLNAVITQEGIFTTQTENTGTSVIEHSSYEQPHSVRQVWPSAVGSPFISDPGQLFAGYLPPGVTLTQEVSFIVPEASGVGSRPIVPADAHIAFFAHISNGSALGPILQGYQRELEGQAVTGPSISVDWGTASQEIVAGETATYNFMVTNNRSEPAQVTINLANIKLPAGWTSEICTSTTDCDQVTNLIYTIPADGSNTFYLKINSTNSEIGETGTLRLIIQGPGDFIAEQNYQASTKTSSVAVPGEIGGLSMTSITPNPASSVARIDVSIPVGGETSLEIYTVGGEKVATLFEGRLEAGMRQIDADVSALESGKYILVLKSGDKKVSRTMTIVR